MLAMKLLISEQFCDYLRHTLRTWTKWTTIP